VREATPEEIDRFRPHSPEEIAARACKAAHDLAGAWKEAEEQKKKIEDELEEATTRLAKEASTPVIDERDQRRRSRERHR